MQKKLGTSDTTTSGGAEPPPAGVRHDTPTDAINPPALSVGGGRIEEQEQKQDRLSNRVYISRNRHLTCDKSKNDETTVRERENHQFRVISGCRAVRQKKPENTTCSGMTIVSFGLYSG